MKTKPMKSRSALTLLVLLALTTITPQLSASPLGTAFSYQGKLSSGANPAQGFYDLRFTIYDAAEGGGQIGSTLTNSAVGVTNGLFTTTLDFGASVFNGDARWLELAVRTNSVPTDFTPLSPRQLVGSYPYALYAPSAGTATTVSGPVAASQLAGTISANHIASGTITGDLLANGAVGSAQLASNITLNGTVTAGSFQGRGALPWNVVSNTTVTASVNNAYLLVNDATTAVALPGTASAGDVVRISGTGAGGWVAQAFTWTARETNRSWSAIAASADGTKLVASVYNGQLYTSTDSGVSWTARETNRLWWAVASSADGAKLAAAVNGGQIYTSTNSGVTWTARESSRNWYAVASSADGAKLVAVVNGGQIYTSTNPGVPWTARESSRSWQAVASSADGTKLVAAAAGGQIYTSFDSGVSWTARDTSRGWKGLASSADGSKLVAGTLGGQIYTSTNSGATWTARESNRTWSGVASSADGTNLAAVVQSGQIYTSMDSGATWTAWGSSRTWAAVASSADGTKLAAVANGWQICTATRYLLSGVQGSGVTLQYLGNSRWQALNEILPGSVTGGMLAAGAVGTAQLASNAVTSVNLAAGAVGSAHLAAGAVTTANLAAGAVTADKVLRLPEVASLLNFTNPTLAQYDLFGQSLAAVGSDLVLIGAPYNGIGAANSGVAYLLDLAGHVLTTFTNPTPELYDSFGNAVAAVGTNQVLIGTPYDSTGATNSGAAYLFDLAGNVLTTFTNPAPSWNDNFGYALTAVGSDRLLISAFRDDTGKTDAGAAYLFDLGGNLITTFTNPTPAMGDWFGYSVAALGTNRVLIGALYDHPGAISAGAAYLFDLAGNLLSTFTNPSGVEDFFGYSVATVGSDRVLIGAPYNDAGATNSGTAYLFDLAGNVLTTFTNPAPKFRAQFGYSVAVAGVRGDRVLIGAPNYNTTNAGAAYLFDLAGNLLIAFNNPTPATADDFGCAVAAVGADRVLLGADTAEAAGLHAGGAYLFTIRDYASRFFAEGVRKGAITSDSLQDGAVTAAKIGGVLLSSQIPELDASKITTGTLADAQLSANVALLGANQVFSGSNQFSGVVVATNASNSISGAFSGSGAALTSLSGAALNAGSVSNAVLAVNAVTGDKIADGTIMAADVAANTFWGMNGNAGTTPGTHFVGTTDNRPLEIKVNGMRALRLEDNGDGSDSNTTPDGAPNVIGGSPLNFVATGVVGATISGGGATNWYGARANSVSSDYGTVGGGLQNSVAAGSFAVTIAGGYYNRIGITNDASVIGGGSGNSIGDSSGNSTIAGGYNNGIFTNSTYGTIGGGAGNDILGNSQGATIAGGYYSDIGANSSYGAISGGFLNFIGQNCSNSVIGGGRQNTLREGAWCATIAGGYYNGISTNSRYSTISGGTNNTIGESSVSSTISGGSSNSIASNSGYATISGGWQNLITNACQASTIGGGWQNSVDGFSEDATIGGGFYNKINANADLSTIGGGWNNSIQPQGRYATIPGGGANSATNYAFAAGFHAKANHTGAFVWGDSQGSDFPSAVGNEVAFRCSGGVRFTSGSGGANQTVSWTPGSPSWSYSSDRNLKEAFAQVDHMDVLAKVTRLPITRWNYKGYTQQHIGPVAQDFHALFPLNDSETTLNSADLDGVALAAIQGLNQKLEEREEALRAENADLKQRMTQLEQLVTSLTQKLNEGEQ
jgi:hypothetical protein